MYLGKKYSWHWLLRPYCDTYFVQFSFAQIIRKFLKIPAVYTPQCSLIKSVIHTDQMEKEYAKCFDWGDEPKYSQFTNTKTYKY